MLRPAAVALLSLLLAGLAPPAAAQADGGAADSSARWSASAGHAVEAFREDRAAWTTTRALVQRRFRRGALALEAGRVERYDRAAAYGLADAYGELWAGTYGNVRALAAPGAVTSAQTDVLAEVYGALPGGWEVSAGARRIDFEADGVWLGTASAATYAGPWLLRARTTVAPSGGRAAVSTSASARLLRETPRGVVSALEVSGGQGQEFVVEAPGATGTLRRSWFGRVSGEWAASGPLALRVGAGYTDDGALSRWSAEGAVVVRW